MMRFVLLLFVQVSVCHAAAFLNGPKPEGHLGDFAEALQKAKTDLEVSLQLNNNGHTQPQHGDAGFSLRGLQLSLGDHAVPDSKIKMPGHPKISSGIREVQIHQPGFFVDITGQQDVKLQDACWELVWEDEGMHGTLVCAFDVPHEVKRNDAVLPQGRLYMSFPVWTHETLAAGRARLTDAEDRYARYGETHDEELAKLKATSNPLAKMMHYQRAADARERRFIMSYSTLKELRGTVPSDDTGIVSVGGILVNKDGALWSKEGDGLFDKIHFGTAHMSESVAGPSSP